MAARWEGVVLPECGKQIDGRASEDGERQLVVGTEQPLFEARVKTSGRYPYDVSADGQRFLINTSLSSADAPPVTLVVNWLAGNQEVKGVA
jgi:hypothetical protein